MRVLIVARRKAGRFAPFVEEQVEALMKQGVECRYFGIDGRRYLSQYPDFMKTIQAFKPNIIHAHYGLCGFFASLQKRVPVVTTYHGSDINNPRVFPISRIAIRRSAFNIFVSQKNIDKARPKRNYALIPCGINLEDFPIVEKEKARRQLGLDLAQKYILFAGAFDNPVKNAPLAKAAVEGVKGVELLELKGYSRNQVALLLNAVDVLLMTSISEGSPQVIKEAMACGCPIVSVDVGDVKAMIAGHDGCFISERKIESIRNTIITALIHKKNTNNSTCQLSQFSNKKVISELFLIYNSL